MMFCYRNFIRLSVKYGINVFWVGIYARKIKEQKKSKISSFVDVQSYTNNLDGQIGLRQNFSGYGRRTRKQLNDNIAFIHLDGSM